MAADDVDGQKFRWRWVDAVRYVVALAMTALIVAVTVHAVTVLLRREELFLRVAGGSVSVERISTTPVRNLSFGLDLETANPSDRLTIYYTDINVFLYGRVNQNPKADYFLSAPVTADIALKPQSKEFVYLQTIGPPTTEPKYKPYWEFFFSNDSSIPEAMLTLNGTLIVGTNSWHNKTDRAATYYCSPITIGVDSSENTAGNALCREEPPTPETDINAP